MNKSYRQSPRFNAGGLATGSILAMIVAMASWERTPKKQSDGWRLPRY